MKSCVLFMGVLFVIVSIGPSVLAQPGSPDCPLIPEDILTSLDSVCAGLERNTACYGYRKVTATFADEAPPDFFTEVGDQASLRTLKTLTTAPADPDTGDWGVALMKVQANIPNTLPGQAVTFVLMGDAEVENAVPPEAALELPDPVTAHTAAPAPLFAAPSDASEMLGVASADTELLADAVSGEGLWTRVAYMGRPAWVFSISLLEEEAVGQLPAIDKDTFTPMQAFFFRTGIGQSACQQAPDMLLVQGPEKFSVDIRANGADIRIGSTVVLIGSQVIAVSGEAVIFPDTPDAVTIPAGQVAGLQFAPLQGLGIGGQASDYVVTGIASPPAPLGDQLREQLAVIEDIPAEVVNYAVEVETSLETAVEVETSPEAAEAPCAPNPEWVYNYTIQSGDTLSAIASLFGLSTSTLMSGNCLTDSVIFAGQTLRVPSEYVPPAEPAPVAPQPETSTGGWGGCGSCNTCGYDSGQCVLSPEGQCLWDPTTCGVAAPPPPPPPSGGGTLPPPATPTSGPTNTPVPTPT